MRRKGWRHPPCGVRGQSARLPGVQFQTSPAAELEHAFRWPTTHDLPERDQIGIFNRSYCQEVLIARGHPEVLRGAGLPPTALDEPTVWRGRYRSIVDLEIHLHHNGTVIITFFLHLSAGEQRRCLLLRTDDPDKDWKSRVSAFRDTLTRGLQPFRYLHDCSGTSGWSIRRVGFSPTGKAQPYHGARRKRSNVVSCRFAGDQIPGMPTKPGKALMRSIQLRTLA